MAKKNSLTDLIGVPTMAAAVPASLGDAPPRLLRVTPTTVAANPVNPRDDIGDLSDLESMKTAGQLQPCVVVTRAAFLAIYAEHEHELGGASFVVVAGSRRRLAAERFGLATLDVVVRDLLAADRATFYGASVSENIDRKEFNPIEEARAVERLVAECGDGVKAGEKLGRSKGWVSQRLALLRLAPSMQDVLRSGELPVRDARRLAQMPADEQEAAWRTERAAGKKTADDRPKVEIAPDPPSGNGRAGRVQLKLDSPVEALVDTLRQHLPPELLRALGEALLAEGLPR